MSPGASGLSLSGPTLVPAGLEGAQKLPCDLQPPPKEAAWAEIGVGAPFSFNKKCTDWGLGLFFPSACWGAPSWAAAWREWTWASWWTPG